MIFYQIIEGYERVHNSLSSEPGFSGLNGLPGLRTVCIIPVEKPRVREGFSEKELQHV